MKYVASTLSAPVEYTGYAKTNNDLPAVTRRVLVQGGAGVANKRNLITPLGVVTSVEDDDAAFLENHPTFKVHKAKGFVRILNNKPEDADAVAADLKGNDPSAPLTPSSYEGTATKAPKTGKGK